MKRRKVSTDGWTEPCDTPDLILHPGEILPTPVGRMTVLAPGGEVSQTWETFSFATGSKTLAALTVCDVDGEILRAARVVSGKQTVYIVAPPDEERVLVQKVFAESGKKLNMRMWAMRVLAGKVPVSASETTLFGAHLFFSKALATQVVAAPARRTRLAKQAVPVNVKSTIEIHVSAAEALGLLNGTLTLATVPVPLI